MRGDAGAELLFRKAVEEDCGKVLERSGLVDVGVLAGPLGVAAAVPDSLAAVAVGEASSRPSRFFQP